jgi:hypothetical protein
LGYRRPLGGGDPTTALSILRDLVPFVLVFFLYRRGAIT